MLYPIYNIDECRVEWVTDDLDTVYVTATSLSHLKTYSDLLFDLELGNPVTIHEIEEVTPVDNYDVQ